MTVATMTLDTSGWDAVHDSRTAFLACLRAQCAPGTPVGPVPSPWLGSAACPDGAAAGTAAGLLLSLLDPGLTLAAAGDTAQLLAEALIERSRATAASVAEADFVLASGDPSAAIAAARRGSRLQPERGATVVVVCGDDASTVTLRGPGIENELTVAVPLGPGALQALRAVNARSPCGVDVLLAGAVAVQALPRSTVIETQGA